ncbi:hypothetical protein LCGC14_1303420 [marine sediment metagenome]|uniref:Uncharacterized protein n=1 Tax=marine sediment metagenome TaxID=412755 RepID=A0A0F9NRW7_9ZZZZ
MSPGEILALAGVAIIALGLGMTWIRNGRSQAKRDGVMEERIKGINKQLEDPSTGLGAIKESVDNMKVHCAEVTSSFKERLKNLEED